MLYQKEQIIKDDEYRLYLNYFCQRFDSYAIQPLPRIKRVKGQFGEYEKVEVFNKWRVALNKDKTFKQLNDNVIQLGHLGRKYWAGAKAPECLSFGLADVDRYSKKEQQEAIEYIARQLRANENQFMYLYPCTSPHNRLHLLFKVQYKGYPVHYSLFRKKLKDAIKPYELYPNHWNYIRLPFGYKQNTLVYDDTAEDLVQQTNWDWKEQLYWFDKLEPIELSRLPFVNEVSNNNSRDRVNRVEFTPLQEAKELFENGLQSKGSRHDSQFKVLLYLYRLNCSIEQAIFLTKRWIEKKHNGFSKEINKGKFEFVYKDIESQGRWIENHLILSRQYPDIVHNQYEGYCCYADLLLCREITQALLKGSILCNENPYIVASRVFNLIEYVRPRRHYEFIYIPKWVWLDIFGRTTTGQVANAQGKSYLALRDALKESRIIYHNDHYKVDSYSESIKFLPQLKVVDESEMIANDNRACHEFSKAVLKAFPEMTTREFTDFTGASRDTYFRTKKRLGSIV